MTTLSSIKTFLQGVINSMSENDYKFVRVPTGENTSLAPFEPWTDYVGFVHKQNPTSTYWSGFFVSRKGTYAEVACNDTVISVTSLSQDVTPQAISPIPVGNITIQYNGCYRVGKIVVIAARLSSAGGFINGDILNNLPVPKSATVLANGYSLSSVANNRNANLTLMRTDDAKGRLYLADAVSDEMMTVNCTYITE